MATHVSERQRDAMPAFRGGITARAIGLGIFLVVVLDAIAVYVRFYYHGSRMVLSHVPMAMLIAFIAMLIVLGIVGRLARFSLLPGEWHTILAMGLVGATLPAWSSTGYLIGYISAPYFYATEDNNWAELLHPHLPDFLIPSNEGHGIAWFFEGRPEGAPIPWDVWMLPLFWWFMAFTAAFVVLACVAVIFRKQWVQNERLAFPAMAPLINMMAEPGGGKRTLPGFMYNRLFWIGFALAFGMIAWNCINYFLPNFPRFPIHGARWHTIDPQFPRVRTSVGLFSIFFSYFASLDVLFSLWVFDLVFILEGGWLNKLGYKSMVPTAYRGVYQWQTRGAFVVLVISMFWVARQHLRDVLMKALGKDDSVDDRDEMLSYRAAVIGSVAGLGYLFIWMMQMDMDPLISALLLMACVFGYIGMAKILADTGMPYTSIPGIPWNYVAPFFGNAAISPSTHVAFRFANLITGNAKGLFLPAAAQVGKLSEGISDDRRKLMAAIYIAFVTSFVTSIFLTLKLGYDEGAFNFNVSEIPRSARNYFKNAANAVKQSDQPPFYVDNPENLVFFGIGGLAMVGLIFMRHRFVWWPLHPVGLALSGVPLIRASSFTLFIAWLIKLVMLKVGGPSVYHKSRPFFIGLLVGYVLGVALSLMLDVIWFPEKGHAVHFRAA